MNLTDYHNHTYLCGHATGSIDEYIESALKKGIKEICFTDHAPLPQHLRENESMKEEESEFYINEIEKRKILFKDRIEIKTGFEVEFPLLPSFNQAYFTDPRIDCMIGSCHFLDSWPFDHPDYTDEFEKRDIDQVYTSYFKIIETLAESRLFDIIGHFDLIKKFGHRPKKKFNSVVEKIAKKISESDTAVEINTSGLLKPVKETYPSDEIIKIMFEHNVPVTIGSDSHAPDKVGYMIDAAIVKLKKVGYRKISGFKSRKRYDILI